MEEHPDCEPCRAVAVNSGNDDDAYRNEYLESQRIDKSLHGIAGVNPGACSTGDVEEVGKALFS